METLRIFGILLRKCWLVSKRHWMKTLLGQILLPVGLVVCAWQVLEKAALPSIRIGQDSHHKMVSSNELIDDALRLYPDGVPIMYAPNNTFTDELMTKVHRCFKNQTDTRKFRTETDLVDFYRENSQKFLDIVVIFDQSTDNSTKHLNYKLRAKSLPQDKLYHPGTHYLGTLPFVQTQLCLSESFVGMKSERMVPQTFIQQVPYPAHFERPMWKIPVSFACTLLLMLALMIPAFVETLKATNEKFVGINVLMSMNGIPNALNLLSWMISGLSLSSLIGAISAFLMYYASDENDVPFASSGNPFIVFTALMFHVAHTIAFDLHVSAYASKALVVMPVISLVNVLAMVLQIYVFEESNWFVAPYVGMVFPIILLYEVISQIYSYEDKVGDLQWSNLFVNGNPMLVTKNSIGMIMVMSAMGMIFHFVLAIYVHAINPGKYGIGHHPLFFLRAFKFAKKQENSKVLQNLVYDDVNDKYFESTLPEAYTPGIQIRNLKKAYDISIFTKQKVNALRGVSIDFYKGQITSLLGHNGAGKSTLMSILTRMTSATDGLILFNSKNLKEKTCEILKDVGLCAQVDMYFPSLTVTEQLEFFAMLKRHDKTRLVVKGNIENLIQNLKLASVKDALPDELSGDQKRKLSLAMALVGDPSTLLLDEPTSGLDSHSKRLVWDILLKIKHQKTILISTHDMDEADILGDRIAVLHDGQLKSYGTPLFLKKIIGGQNSVEVTLSIERWTNVDKILEEIHHEAAVVNQESCEIVLSVPTLTLPQWLRNLEERQNDLDISGYNLPHISLEQVFLKLTKENAGRQKSHRAVTSYGAKLKGPALHLQYARALFFKKMAYTLKDSTTILIQIFMVIVTALTVAIVQTTRKLDDRPPIPMDLNMYDSPRTLYASFNTTTGDRYENVSRILGGNPEVTYNNLDDELIRWAKKDLADYAKRMIAAAEFSETRAKAFYSDIATHSLPISVNLLWNAIIQNTLGPEYSISLSIQQLPTNDLQVYSDWIIKLSYSATVVFMILFSFVFAMFVVHPSRERFLGIKLMQKMTGVSGFVYWGTMFLFDLAVCAFFALLLIVGFAFLDYSYDLPLYRSDDIAMTVYLLMLFAINALPLIYSVSFIEMKTKNLVKLLTFVPVGLVLFAFAIIFIHAEIPVIHFIHSTFMLLPYVSLTHGCIEHYRFGSFIAKCDELMNYSNSSHCSGEVADECCVIKCQDGNCSSSTVFYREGPISLKKSEAYLRATPILYFGILAVLEWRLFPRLMAEFKKQRTVESAVDDEAVKREKSIVFQQVQALSGDQQKRSNSLGNRAFLAYELQKSYRKVKAVTDVSFGVDRRECFGLFGVNGVGKSTF